MEHVQCGRKNRATIKNGDVQSRSRRQSSNRKQVKQESITRKTNASTYNTKLFICATEKIDWNRSPKAISSEWFWSPPASPMKEKEEVEDDARLREMLVHKRMDGVVAIRLGKEDHQRAPKGAAGHAPRRAGAALHVGVGQL